MGSTPFRYLSNAEFASLTQAEKIVYLQQALNAVAGNAPIIAVITPPPDAPKDDKPKSG